MSDYLDIIERLEKATGPDSELEIAIAEAMGWRFSNTKSEWKNPTGKFGCDFPDYMTSIDAALTLVPEGWWMTLQSKGQYHHAELEYVGPGEIECSEIDCDEIDSRNCPTPAIAICIAALKARAAQ